jgi:hypothetical protein
MENIDIMGKTGELLREEKPERRFACLELDNGIIWRNHRDL